jgi:hypothetical protein
LLNYSANLAFNKKKMIHALIKYWLQYLCAFRILYCSDRQHQIDHLLGYAINLVHKIQEHIDYMYHWMSRLDMIGVYKFYMEHQILIIFNSLLEEWMSVQLSLEYRLESLDLNNLADEMLFERER